MCRIMDRSAALRSFGPLCYLLSGFRYVLGEGGLHGERKFLDKGDRGTTWDPIRVEYR